MHLIRFVLSLFRFSSILSLVITGLLGGLLLIYVWGTFHDRTELVHAKVTQSVHSQLQTIVIQAANRLNTPPNRLSSENVINAIRTHLPEGAKLTATGLSDLPYQLTFTESNRKVLFLVSLSGDVQIKRLFGHWTRFRLSDGVLCKN